MVYLDVVDEVIDDALGFVDLEELRCGTVREPSEPARGPAAGG